MYAYCEHLRIFMTGFFEIAMNVYSEIGETLANLDIFYVTH